MFNSNCKNIAITGGIGCGKSTVTEFFKQKGFQVFSADKMCHQLLDTAEVSGLIINRFGADVLDKINKTTIDRKKLAAKVFNNDSNLEFLNSLLHDKVRKQIQLICTTPNVKFVEVPLLYETNMAEMFDQVIAVWSEQHICKQRVLHWNNGEFERRSAKQFNPNKKLEQADIGIINNGSIQLLHWQLEYYLDN